MATIHIDRLLETVVRQGASDLHLTVGRPPVIRLDGRLRSLETKVLTPDDTRALMKAITPDRNQQELSEEGRDDLARLDSRRTWIVDPLDGTREFGEVPREDWAVHVALVEAATPIAGAVALPARGMTLQTSPAPPPAPTHDGKPRIR